jgi:GT2 family glycosyltransferase
MAIYWSGMKLTVLVPTYKRVVDLSRCLTAISVQTRLPDEVLLVVRFDDTATLEAIPEFSRFIRLVVVQMTVSGQVHALNAGLAAATGDIVAITDDDAAPRADWLERIERHFADDSMIGGVGGRDWVHHGTEVDERQADVVGRIQWFGRVVGNHHLGHGVPRDVDILKGANMSYRLSALSGVRFDSRLRGQGAQVSNDLAFSLAVRRNGWRLLYDPEVAVDHYPAPRFDLDQRNSLDSQAIEDAAFNQYWALGHSMPPGMKRCVTCVWQEIVGSKAQPGILLMAFAALLGRKDVLKTWKAVERGRDAARYLARELD